MVTKEEMQQSFNKEKQEERVAYQVTLEEMGRFDDNKAELAEMISDRKKLYERENNISAINAYLDIEDMCQIKMGQMKKVMCGKFKITRNFLYTFVVGFKMDIDEANEYFKLCGGPLAKDNPADYICLNALRDEDDIQSLVDEFDDFLNIKIGFNRKNS